MEHKTRQNRELKSWKRQIINFHSTIKFTAEMSETEITFLDTKAYKGVRGTNPRRAEHIINQPGAPGGGLPCETDGDARRKF